MKYLLYDGSLDGLLTIIYDYYRDIPDINIGVEKEQIDFLERVFIKTDKDKAARVKKTLKDKLGQGFIHDLKRNFKSKDKNKDSLIAGLIKLCLHHGRTYLGSASKMAIRFRENSKAYGHELHQHKGFTRFRKIQEGFLFTEITPENNILEDLSAHFLKRMPAEKFIIYDKARNIALISIKSEVELVDVVEFDIKESSDEAFFKRLWQGFYDSISIKERENKDLMISNMPKKYWHILPERKKDR